MERDAVLSPCKRYRYRLTRGAGRLLAFVMLNPSTADAEQDDPTIRRCLGFAAREGFDGIEVCNVYAWRATDPRELMHAPNPFRDNDDHLLSLAVRHNLIVCAWGSKAMPSHVEHVRRTLSANRGGHVARLVCLGVNKDGSPKHPLYVRGDAPLIDWPQAGGDRAG